jgi:GT2 family glycosyltransferase
MKIAAIILNYNSAADTRKCIEFLQKQKLNEELHVIVVDNNSSEELGIRNEELWSTVNFLSPKAQRPMVQQSTEVIYAEENRGYSAGNNIGLRRATEIGAKYALVINPDMELTDVNYIARLVEVMERDEDVVVAATDIVTPEGIHQNPMLPDGDWHSAFGWVKEIFSRKKPVDTYSFIDNYKESHVCAKVSGCCLMLRMSFVEEIGYFDEYPFLYCEEAILARQVEMAGKKMFYLADTQAVHRHVKSEKGDPVKRFKHWQRSRIYFYRRYSKDSWWGRWISILSMRLYVLVFTIYRRFISH